MWLNLFIRWICKLRSIPKHRKACFYPCPKRIRNSFWLWGEDNSWPMRSISEGKDVHKTGDWWLLLSSKKECLANCNQQLLRILCGRRVHFRVGGSPLRKEKRKSCRMRHGVPSNRGWWTTLTWEMWKHQWTLTLPSPTLFPTHLPRKVSNLKDSLWSEPET